MASNISAISDGLPTSICGGVVLVLIVMVEVFGKKCMEKSGDSGGKVRVIEEVVALMVMVVVCLIAFLYQFCIL